MDYIRLSCVGEFEQHLVLIGKNPDVPLGAMDVLKECTKMAFDPLRAASHLAAKASVAR